MREIRTSATGSPSPWWALLLLPVCLIVGWMVGQLPSASRPQAMVAEQGTANVAIEPDRGPAAGRSESRETDRVSPGPAQEAPRPILSSWTSFDNAVAESRRNGKPVLIDFNADWCPPCQAMKREVFDDRRRGEAVQIAVIPVSIVDRAREQGRNPRDVEDLQQQYQVDAFPTLILFSPATGRMIRTKGYGGADRTVAWITVGAKSVR